MQQEPDVGSLAAVFRASIFALIASISTLMAATLALSGVSFRFSRCRSKRLFIIS